jgi:hypothetical protein
MKTCSIAGCTRVLVARGWCGPHWQRWRRYGDPLGSISRGAHMVKPPLYVLPHGIEVIGEYAPNASMPYWRVRMRPHPFFPGVRVISNGITVHRSRAILASKLGRALTPADHAHHEDETKDHDVADNLELLTAAQHNQHHKTGTKHSAASRAKTSATLKALYAAGVMKAKPIAKRDIHGRISR